MLITDPKSFITISDISAAGTGEKPPIESKGLRA